MALLIGSFPDGFVERRWQRLALRCSWVIPLVRRWLCLLTCRARVRGLCGSSTVRGELIAWLAQPAARLALNSGWVLLVGAGLVCPLCRADAAGRAQLRVIFVVVLGPLLYFAGMVAQALGAPANSALVVTMNTLGR